MNAKLVFLSRIHFIKFDVSDKTAWATVWDEAERIMGGKVEVFANNAGINPLVIEMQLSSLSLSHLC